MSYLERARLIELEQQRLKTAIECLEELRASVDGERRDELEGIITRLKEALEDDAFITGHR